MNLFGKLPASNSPQFSLNALDWHKIRRLALTQLVGLFVSVTPMLLGFTYKFHGTDYTPIVVTVVGWLAEAGRRFVSKG
jgi:hypothetical protein